MHRAVVDVAHQNRAFVISRILVSLVNLHARVSRHEMFVVNDRRQKLISVRERRVAGLAHKNSTRRHVKQVIDDTRAHKRISGGVPIDTPLIAGAFRDDFEFLGFWKKTRDGGGHEDFGFFRSEEHTSELQSPYVISY